MANIPKKDKCLGQNGFSSILIQSYEKVGYHVGTNAFIRGLAAAQIEIIDNRVKASF